MDQFQDTTQEQGVASCDSSFTRSEFIRRAAKGAVAAGVVFGAPVILDKFLVPPAYAQTSTCSLTLGSGTTSANALPDTVVQTATGESYQISCNNNDGNESVCMGTMDHFGSGFTC